jgi:hypothetical protein
MISETARIQREIDTEKAELIDNLTTLENKARDVADWRARIRKHPWESVGIALAAGAALGLLTSGRAPRRERTRSKNEDAGDDDGAPARSHPILEHALDTFVAVAAARTVELLKDAIAPE